MKAVQKLELYSSISMLITGLIQIFFFLSSSKDHSANSYMGILILGFIFILFPSLVIVVGSYLHIANKSIVGFGIVLLDII